MDEISFVETSSVVDETNISKNVSIAGNEGDRTRTFFNQTRPEICSHNYGVNSIFGLFMKS